MNQAVAENIRYDHRVSVEREKEFDAYVRAAPRLWNDLQRPIKDYFWERVRQSADPDYVREVNRDNIVVGGIENRRGLGDEEGLRDEVKLGTVLDLSGLLEVYRWAQAASIEPFASASGDFDTIDRLARYLDRVGQGTEQDIEAFLKQVFEALRRKVDEDHPFNPVWAVLWQDLEVVLDEAPERWLEVVGVAKQEPGRWLVALQYTVGEAGTLVRPTLLDAGWNGYHFPSPPQAHSRRCGHPMNLGDYDPVGRLPREYIHSQISHKVEHWRGAGRKFGLTARAVTCRLAEQRRRHHQRLTSLYGSQIHGWMP